MLRPLPHEVLTVAGGSIGTATAALRLEDRRLLDTAIVEPAVNRSCQSGWTMVGGGIVNDPEASCHSATAPRGRR